MTGEILNYDELIEYHLDQISDTQSSISKQYDHISHIEMINSLLFFRDSWSGLSEWSYNLICRELGIVPYMHIQYKYDPVYTEWQLPDVDYDHIEIDPISNIIYLIKYK
jgi:hypothetical protein